MGNAVSFARFQIMLSYVILGIVIVLAVSCCLIVLVVENRLCAAFAAAALFINAYSMYNCIETIKRSKELLEKDKKEKTNGNSQVYSYDRDTRS